MLSAAKDNVNGDPNGSIEVGPKSKDKVVVSDATPETPLKDRTNDSVPQKVNSKRPTPVGSKSTLTVAPPPVSDAASDATPPSKSPFKNPLKSHQASDALPPISDPGYLLTPKPRPGVARFARVGMAGSWDRALDTPELPKGWTGQHDRAICYLDVRGYGLDVIVKKLRNYFPELYGQLTVHMVDKRLRQLDQNLEITYWADAMRDIEAANNAVSPSVTPTTPTPETYTPTGAASRMVSVANLRESTAVTHPKVKVGVELAIAHSTADSPADLTED